MGSAPRKGKVPADTVLLHGGMHGRNGMTPTASPFVFKLELYLRITKIPYKFAEKSSMGPKGKVPWIQYNGETICDSSFIIKYLNKKHNVDLNKNLSEQDRGIATAFKVMVEEFLYYAFMLETVIWPEPEDLKKIQDVPTPLMKIFRNRLFKKVKAQGLGLHSKEEVREIYEEQIAAIASLLGDKQYLFGDEPSEMDCSVTGVVGLLKWLLDEDKYPRKLLEQKYKNLDDYLERMKATYFPDWDELLVGGKKTSKAAGDGATSQ